MSAPEHYLSQPYWHDHPWDYEAMGHKPDGVRPCQACSKPIDSGWVTECGNGPWCSPECMGWDDRNVMEEDLEVIGDSLYFTEWVESNDSPEWRAEQRAYYQDEWDDLGEEVVA